MQNKELHELKRLLRSRNKVDKEIKECFEEYSRLIRQLNIDPIKELLISTFSLKKKTQDSLEQTLLYN
jgi:hypothetical protein